MRKFIVISAFFLCIFLLFSCSKEPKVVISFIENGGSEVEDIIVTSSNASINLPIPERLGYTFNGWYTDASLTEPFVAVFLTDASITLYAKWTINQYTITFDSNEGTEIEEITQDYNTDVFAPIDPEKIGHTFDGWYSDSNLTLVYTFTKIPAEDITIYAKWTVNTYTLQFLDDDNTVLQSTTYLYNALLNNVIPPTPIKKGYSFDRWDQELPDFMPAANVTLKASYIINQYTMTFDSNDGTQIDAITQDFNTNISAPNNPEKIGHTFGGWYSDSNFSTPFIFDSMPAEDITIYAKWIVNQYEITYYITDANDPSEEIVLYPNDEVIQVCYGESHYAILTLNGRLFMQGQNDYGALGNNQTNISDNVPIEITDYFDLDDGDKIIQISLGVYVSSALTAHGRLFMWGYNFYGQLGDNTNISRLVPTEITNQFNLTSGDKIIQVALGLYWHSAALTSNGRLFMWGYNEYGQLGEITWMDRSTPYDITNRFNLGNTEKIIQVSLGGLHSSALTSNGRFFTWGYNDYGQLGDNTIITKSAPNDITSRFNLDSGDKIIYVSLGLFHSSALTLNGRLFTFGLNSYGQLGDNTDNDKHVPTEITNHFNLDSGDRIIQASMGWSHSSAITLTGRYFTWGRNDGGQLGDNTTIHRYVPVDITSRFELDNDDKMIFVSAGFDRSSAITSKKKVFIWGWGALTPLEYIIYEFERYVILYNYQSSIEYIPINEGYTFVGWYLDDTLTILNDIEFMPAENMILYGKWVIE